MSIKFFIYPDRCGLVKEITIRLLELFVLIAIAYTAKNFMFIILKIEYFSTLF